MTDSFPNCYELRHDLRSCHAKRRSLLAEVERLTEALQCRTDDNSRLRAQLAAVSKERDALLKKKAELNGALARPIQEQLERETDEAAADLAACPEARWAENRRLASEYGEADDAQTG